MLANINTGVTGSVAANDQSIGDLDALKVELAMLRDEVAKVVEYRAKQAQRAAQAGVSVARDTVTEYPLASVATAFAVGAAVGLVLISPRKSAPARFGTFEHADQMRADLANYAGQLKANIMHTVRDNSIIERLDRVASALSSTDAKATVGPVMDRVMGWLGQAKDAAQTAASKATGT